MRHQPVWTAVTALLCGCAAMVAAQGPLLDYTQWRGRDRDGAASGFREPASWPETLTRRWKVDVGEGYGTPLVVGNTVYTFTRQQASDVLTALNAETGKLLWRTAYPSPYAPSPPAAAHGAGPKATPLFHEGKVFTHGVSGILAAFDAAGGTLLWKTPAPTEPPSFSAASSPVGGKGTVIVHPGNYGPLTAFDAGTGAVKWIAGDDGLFASPIVVDLAGSRQVVSATQRNVIGVRADDHHQRSMRQPEQRVTYDHGVTQVHRDILRLPQGVRDPAAAARRWREGGHTRVQTCQDWLRSRVVRFGTARNVLTPEVRKSE